MHDLPQQKLSEIIAQYGRSLCDDPQRCEGLLRDFCGQYRKEISALVGALKERVPADILSSQSTTPRTVLLARLTKRLQDNLALAEEASRWAVESWALALGAISKTDLTSLASSSPPSEVKEPSNPAVAVAEVGRVKPNLTLEQPAMAKTSPTASTNGAQPPPTWIDFSSLPAPVSAPPTQIATHPAAAKDWLKAVITGGIIGGCILLGLVLSRVPPSLQPATDSPSPSDSVSSPIPQDTTSVSKPSSISQAEALNLIKSWQRAKRRIFAPPYDRQLGAELLMGKEYLKNISNPDSSVNWLENNNAYYTYQSQQVEEVESFTVNEGQAILGVYIAEGRTFCKDGSPVLDGNTTYEKRLYRYTLQSVNGQWKIADHNSQLIEQESNAARTCNIVY
jgi:hypothetical protein